MKISNFHHDPTHQLPNEVKDVAEDARDLLEDLPTGWAYLLFVMPNDAPNGGNAACLSNVDNDSIGSFLAALGQMRPEGH